MQISVADGYTTILSGDPVGERAEVLVSPLQVSLSQGLNKHINLTQWLDSIDVGAPSEGPGMVGQYYHGDHYVDNSFVQKRWVEEKLQDSGRNYKIYRALLKGIRGTFEPLFVELEIR
ncbi:hypothetical protein ACFOEQ_10980 [Chryseobacterium arachidis]|uniref:hypothetical protein n=1 Tax=Chryseobacterium arachidis TaxID=1416778 RepID=UPI00361425B1